MAFYVDQIRRDEVGSLCMTTVPVIPTYVHSANPFGGEKDFFDFALTTNSTEGFLAGNTYYLRFSIRKIPQYFYSADNSLNRYNLNYNEADILHLSILLQADREETGNSYSYKPEGSDQQVTQQYGNLQKIGSCTVPMKPLEEYEYDSNGDIIRDSNNEPVLSNKFNSDYSSFSFIFTPRSQKRYIVFKNLRTTYDAIEKDNSIEGLQGRTWLLDQFLYSDSNQIFDKNKYNWSDENYSQVRYIAEENTFIEKTIYVPNPNRRIIYTNDANLKTMFNLDGECSKLNNIFEGKGVTPLSKIGYQARPGSIIVVNNEPIRVGRSGIFEINSGIEINSVKIAAPNGVDPKNLDAFLLDYAYTKK